MGDVLVYVDPPINDRLLAFARPLADAAGGALVALVAGGEPAGADALAAADVVLEVSHPALSPYLPEAHQAVLAAAIAARAPDLVLVENTTPGYDLAAAAAAAAGLPFVGYCVGLSLEGGEAQSISEVYGGQLQATVRTAAAGGVRDQLGCPARRAGACRPRASASSSRRPRAGAACGPRSSSWSCRPTKAST